MTGPVVPQTPPGASPDRGTDPREAQIATLMAQLRLLAAQADALRADLARRDAEIAALSARLLAAEQDPSRAMPPVPSSGPSSGPPETSSGISPAAPARGLWSRLTGG